MTGAFGSYRTKVALVIAMTLTGGCAPRPAASVVTTPPEQAQLRQKSIQALKRGITYKQAGMVRAQSIEVLQRHLGNDALPWIRNALHDEEAGVRFAAILALGTLKDKVSYTKILDRVADENVGIQIAAYYALHKMGNTSYTARLPEILLNDPDPGNRRNAAFILGLLGERGVVKVLARGMKDKNAGVTDQVVESLAALRNAEAIQQLTFQASSGMGPQRVSAINALAELRDPELAGTFSYKLNEGDFVETKLSAARALGMIGKADGFKLAMTCIAFDSPVTAKNTDPGYVQVRRVRLAAITALGAIGDLRALGALKQELLHSDDPGNQIAAADAILQILGPRVTHFSQQRKAFDQNRNGQRP